MSEGETTKKHKEDSRKAVAAIITLSDTRTIKEDTSGHLIKELLEKDGHKVVEHIVIPDNKEILIGKIKEFTQKANLIITNGGTGVSRKDITPESIEPMYTKKLTSFSSLYAVLSYNDIGASAIVSRASAGIIGKTAVFSMPGSPKAVKLGMEKLILPEIGHIVKHLGD